MNHGATPVERSHDRFEVGDIALDDLGLHTVRLQDGTDPSRLSSEEPHLVTMSDQ
jgi:hypothetical protein